MATVNLIDIKKSYGKTEVLHNINVQIDKGEFLVVVGPSGCGKSSLLRMVAGLEDVTSGQITINERCVNQLPPAKRDIAMVFQNYALYPHMNVFDNMAYGLKMRKVPQVDIAKEVKSVAQMLQLTTFLTRKPSELSGGQKQRVAMGRAIVRQPAVFLFDEPLSNLDAKLRTEMRLEIKKLQKRLAITSLYVTHDQTEAMTMADKIMVLNKGFVEQLASPDIIYHKPASVFVAGFMGANPMNIFEGSVDDSGQQIHCKAGFSIPLQEKLSASTKVLIGIRPEHLIFVENQALAKFKVSVDLIEILGVDKMVHGVAVSSEESVTIRVEYESVLKEQSSLFLDFDTKYVSIFDKESGLRLGD